jgi:proteasome lid subunit RPN8/RPN11
LFGRTVFEIAHERIERLLERLSIGADLLKSIFHHLQETYPNEGGGFLLGTVDAARTAVHVREVRPITNTFPTEEQFHRYAMTPLDWAKMEDEADAAGLVLLGYYHSHPDWPAIPSEFDRVHALPNFSYLITSVHKGAASNSRAWQLSDDRTAFHELDLSITG